MKRPEFTNQQYGAALTNIAAVYSAATDEQLRDHPSLNFYCVNKEELLRLVKLFGGRWTKGVDFEDREYASIYLCSTSLPVVLSISRDKVCKKTVTYNCEPMFSLEDEIDAVTA